MEKGEVHAWSLASRHASQRIKQLEGTINRENIEIF
jgi:hypothetical protein